MKDIPALILFILGASGIVFFAVQSGWWLLGIVPCVAGMLYAAHREIRAQDREWERGS